MAVTSFLLLSSLGIVITSQAQECSRPVGGPNMNLRGNDILLETFPDGTIVSFACDIGYRPIVGSASITCTGGSWSPVQLKCEKRNCGSAGQLDNGQIEYPTGSAFGDKAVVSCDVGYMLVGKREITCGEQGWMDRLPVCEVVRCEPPSSIADGSFRDMKDIYEYSEVVEYSCKRDYTLKGSSILSCSDEGKFKPDPPTCTMVQCENVEIEHGDWVGGSRPPFRYKSAIRFQCRAGFTMKGSSTVTCDINSQWSPGLPQCIKIPTTPKPSTTTTTTTISPIVTKKPTGTSDPTDSDGTPDPTDPDGSGEGTNNTAVICGVLGTCAVAGAATTGAIVYRKKKGDGSSDTDKEATDNEEALALGKHQSSTCPA